jgi:hypothetical protein
MKKYGKVLPKIVKELVPRQTVHIDLIGPYTVTAKQMTPSDKIAKQDLHLTAMTMIDPATGWIEIGKVPYYGIEDILNKGCEYVNKSSAQCSQLFNNSWLSKYP